VNLVRAKKQGLGGKNLYRNANQSHHEGENVRIGDRGEGAWVGLLIKASGTGPNQNLQR